VQSGTTTFSEHVQNDHNMWKYLWYIIYLEERSPMEYTGLEQFVVSISETIRWLPLKKARVLRSLLAKYDMYTVYTSIQTLQTELGHVTRVRLDVIVKERWTEAFTIVNSCVLP
jgi:hypothetical protein